jgi:manganese-dependent inorganic pyrophosphatase
MFYICGHKNPDTDSIVSAIVMEDYFKKLGEKAKAIRVGKINRETEFVLKQTKTKLSALIKNLAKKQVFLVDHNELEQAGDGIDKAKIVGALDHHRLSGDIKTSLPIYFRVEPVGCTSTLIFKLFQEKEILLNKKQAFLLLCAILSDTLKFNSPTTTKEDIKIAKKLSEISKQNINELAEKMFKAKSDIIGINLKDLILQDFKKYSEKNVKFGIGVCETVLPETILEKKQKILELLPQIKKQKKLDLMFFVVVDIIKKQTYLFVAGEKEKLIAEKSFNKKLKDNLFFLPGVVSRKKQIVPGIINAL